jgi:hypothetical protein
MSKATVNTHSQAFVWKLVLISVGKYQGIQLLDVMVTVSLVLQETTKLPSKVAMLVSNPAHSK